jgi:hypothetical protein
MDLTSSLPTLLPIAIKWAEARAAEVAKAGAPLTIETTKIALVAGVIRPELIHVALVQTLPLPNHPMLREAALQTGLLGTGMAGLTLGYSVIIRRGCETTRLLSHEFRHVHQYESAGSIAAFLPLYLRQIVEFGYHNAPLENDARNHEFDESP